MIRRNRVRCVVVGGGITGLSAAYRLLDLGSVRDIPLEVIVLEASSRVGGHIRTEKIGDYLVEGGPDKLLAQKPAALGLCKRLGLAEDLVTPDSSRGGLSVVYRGRLVPLPPGFVMMVPTRFWATAFSPLFSVKGKLRIAMEPWVRARGDGSDESVASFVTRRLGREVFERVAEPIFGGLYLSRAESLSLRFAAPQLLELERKYGSVIRGMRRAARERSQRSRTSAGLGAFFAPRDGLGRIVDELAACIGPHRIRLDTPVEALRWDARQSYWNVITGDGRAEPAEAVILACPSNAASELVREFDRPLAMRLDKLGYASCATVTLAYPKPAVGAEMRGFGFFIPRTEKHPVLACGYDSLKFEGRAPADEVLLRVFVGGESGEQVLRGDDDAIRSVADTMLRRVFRIRSEPVLARVHRFPEGMPQYGVGHEGWIAEIRAAEERHPGLFLAGSPVGDMGVPDCIRSGQQAGGHAHLYLEALTEPASDPTGSGGSRMQAIP